MFYKLLFIGVAFFTGTAIYGDPVAGVLLTPFGWIVGKAVELNHLLRRQLSSPALVRTVASQKEERISAETQCASSDEESSNSDATQEKEKAQTQPQQNHEQLHEELVEKVAEAIARKMAGRFLTQEELKELRQVIDQMKALQAELFFQQKDRNTNQSKYLH